MNPQYDTDYTYPAEIVREYYAYDGSISDAINGFLDRNVNYRVKMISTTLTHVQAHGIYALVVYELKEV